MPHHSAEAHVLSPGEEERAQLLVRLIANFEYGTLADRAWVAEALHREADVKAGKSQMIRGPDVLARIKAGNG